MANKKEATAEELRQALEYDADAGVVYWRIGNSRRRAGDLAGTKGTNGYIYINYKYKMYLAHRIAWLLYYGHWPATSIDHINRNKADNRIVNLRLCPNNQRDNAQNVNLRPDNTSGFTGVHLYKRTGKYQAYINVAKKKVALGYFNTAEEAHRAYNKAKGIYHTFNPENVNG